MKYGFCEALEQTPINVKSVLEQEDQRSRGSDSAGAINKVMFGEQFRPE